MLIFVEIQLMKSVLVIGYVWPEPKSSAAGSRMMQLLEFFLKYDYQVTFATTATPTPFIENLENAGISTRKIRLNDPSFDEFIQELQPDVVIFDRFMMEEQFGWRIEEHCPTAIKILDTEDLHFLRKIREQAFKKQLDEKELYQDSEVAKREIASIYRCDLSLLISDAEMDLLTLEFTVPASLLFYLPFMLEKINASSINAFKGFEERQHFMTIGNFKHEPNRNSVHFLKEKIWPLIRRSLPEVEMHIYGAYPDKKIESLNDPGNGFLIKGRAESSNEVMQNARICLAPIRFGAGIKGKLVEAMQCGTPSVTTSIGAEGIPFDRKWAGKIEDSAKQFAQAAIELYSDKETWLKAQKRGGEIYNKVFSIGENEERFLKQLKYLEENLTRHRKQNFTGAMLKHHQHRSTYYLSKYIEIKNKLGSTKK